MMERDEMDWPVRRRAYFKLDPRFQKEFIRYLLQKGRSGWVRSLTRPRTTVHGSSSPAHHADELLKLPSASLQREKMSAMTLKMRKSVRHNLVQRANGSPQLNELFSEIEKPKRMDLVPP